MKLLAVIINYRTFELTLRAVEAELRELESFPGSRIALIDNASGDGSAERLQAAIAERGWGDRVDFIQSPRNGGFAYGVNLAVRPALAGSDPPEYVHLLNSDARPGPGAVATLISFLDAHPEVGIAGSYIHGPEGETHGTAFGFPSAVSEFEHAIGIGPISRLLDRWVVVKPVPTVASRVDWLAGASMMIRRQVFDSVGLLDEHFFMYFEETDFCRRAARADWPTWYLPESRVEHIGAASTGWKDFSKPRAGFWFEGRRYYFAKNYGRPYLWATNWLFIVGWCVWRLRAWIERQPNRYPPRFVRDFLRHNFTFRPLPRPPD